METYSSGLGNESALTLTHYLFGRTTPSGSSHLRHLVDFSAGLIRENKEKKQVLVRVGTPMVGVEVSGLGREEIEENKSQRNGVCKEPAIKVTVASVGKA